ncbi:tetracycline resistance protein transposon [Chryseobacterium sp. StRB126]|uniref:FAD-dependent oxidoreductase n=1 Tax=Chryseobacterium sp. StRB126 TaxID=878220 RepID=UPI0004E98D41|nr:FAD-dependent monooxygenase [Chryseobacterium sp. StRB126]BAP31137.1 tetracycline resistance protein transposon [Chryseobacterium sp. StRB126]
MLIDNISIAIVGGGPAGLTLARLLQLKNAYVKVYERDFNKEARVQGSPLDMHENSGLAAISKADLLEEFKKTFRPGADKTLIMNEQAEILFSDHDTKPDEDFGAEHFRPEIDRGPLRNMLLESLHPDTVVWDSHFISMEPQNEGWLIHFKNGTSAYADLVIAADGAHSKIRPYLTDNKPVYSGVIMLEGIVSKQHAPHINALINGGKIMAFGNSKNILMGQKGNGDLGFYASFKAEENWAANSKLDFSDNTAILHWFKTEYPEWNEIWHELFENAVIPFIPRPIYAMPLDQSWETKSNITLIGDAAHVMPPFAGEGANMAMLDALELSEHLTDSSYTSLQEAISHYEINMRKRAADATKESLENGERMHSETALATMLEFFSGHLR